MNPCVVVINIEVFKYHNKPDQLSPNRLPFIAAESIKKVFFLFFYIYRNIWLLKHVWIVVRELWLAAGHVACLKKSIISHYFIS